MEFNCSIRTDVGHKRKLNEDSLLSLPEHGVWAVADGMGGHDSGEVASALVIEAVANAARTEGFDARIARVTGALGAANDSLIAIGRAQDQKRTMGSTVVALLLEEGRYCCLWVGDSRAYLIRHAEVEQLTRDHSLVQDLVDAGMLAAEEAENHPDANVLTRAVGASSRFRVDRVSGTPEPGDIFLLASDGLTRLVSKDEILAELSGRSLEAAADALLQLTLGRGAPDNVSFALVAVP